MSQLCTWPSCLASIQVEETLRLAIGPALAGAVVDAVRVFSRHSVAICDVVSRLVGHILVVVVEELAALQLEHLVLVLTVVDRLPL